jgi:hypothetical protein
VLLAGTERWDWGQVFDCLVEGHKWISEMYWELCFCEVDLLAYYNFTLFIFIVFAIYLDLICFTHLFSFMHYYYLAFSQFSLPNYICLTFIDLIYF